MCSKFSTAISLNPSNKHLEYSFEKIFLVMVASVTGIWYFAEISRLSYVANYIERKILAEKWISGGKTMMRVVSKLFVLGVLVVLLSASVGCEGLFGPIKPGKKIMLFNGKDLAGWKLFIQDETIDVHEIWSVRDGVVDCKGKPNGYMRTKAEYANYKLHLEWRWPDEPTNSGVLLHASGQDNVWPRCIECQLQAGSAGDFVLINGTGITVDGRNRQNAKREFVEIFKKKQSSEKPAGQWNSYDIYCEEDIIRCYVNGVLQNEGTNATDISGWICLQSEGGPVEFRNIYIEPLD